jgi:hypothetical protein
MSDLTPLTDVAFAIEDAHLVRLRGPINAHKPLRAQHGPSPGLCVDLPCGSITPVLALDGASPHWRDRTDNLAGAQIRPRRSQRRGSQALPARQPISFVHRSTVLRGGLWKLTERVDAKNAPTSSLENERRVFHSYHSLTIYFPRNT